MTSLSQMAGGMSDQDINAALSDDAARPGPLPVDAKRGARQLTLLESIEPCGPCGENEGVVVGLW